jgi:hypothetical protein
VSNNATHVAASQREVEYLAYWNVMFSSTDPTLKDEAAWLQRGPGITVWEVCLALLLEVLAALSCTLLRLLEMRLLILWCHKSAIRSHWHLISRTDLHTVCC